MDHLVNMCGQCGPWHLDPLTLNQSQMISVNVVTTFNHLLVGIIYFCESGKHEASNNTKYTVYTSDPLWDGQGCGYLLFSSWYPMVLQRLW